jgi:CBS domain-containing protein
MLGLRMTDPVGRLVGEVVATVRPSATLREAARQLVREQLGLLVMVDGSGVRGVLSERDLVAAIAEDTDLDAERVIDHGSDDVIVVDEATAIVDAATTMAASEVRHLAVARHGEIVGIISARDLVALLAESQDQVDLTRT